MSWGNRIVCALCAVCLAVSFVGAGFVAAAVPDAATTSLADKYAGTTNPNTPFSHDELCDMALAGKRYTFDENDRFALYQAIYDINESAAESGRAKRGALDLTRWDALASQDDMMHADASAGAKTSPFRTLAMAFGAADASAGELDRMRVVQPSGQHVEELLSAADEAYVLDTEAISHLDDVFGVVAAAEPVLAGIAIAALICAVGVCASAGRRAFGSVLVFAGVIVLVAFAALGIWAAGDFEGLFAVFHSLFFASGSWVFSADSLLITMYPEPFWIGMGAIWLAVTAIASAVAIAVGIALKRA